MLSDNNLNELLKDYIHNKTLYINEVCQDVMEDEEHIYKKIKDIKDGNAVRLRNLILTIRQIIKQKDNQNPEGFYSKLFSTLTKYSPNIHDIQHIIYNTIEEHKEEHLEAVDKIYHAKDLQVFQEKLKEHDRHHLEEIDDIKLKFNKLELEHEQDVKHIKVLENEIQDYKDLQERLQKENNELKSEFNIAKKKLEDLSNTANSSQNQLNIEHEDFEKKITSLQTEISVLQNQNEKLVVDFNLKQKEYNQTAQDLLDANNKIDSLENHLNQKVETLDNKLKEKENEIKFLSQEKEDLVSKYNINNNSLREKERQLTDTQNKIDNLTNSNILLKQDYENKINSLKIEVDTLISDKEKLQGDVNKALASEKQKSQLATDIENKTEGEINHLKNLNEELNQTVFKLKNELNERDSDALSAKQKLQQVQDISKAISQEETDNLNKIDLQINELQVKLKGEKQKVQILDEEMQRERETRIKEKNVFEKKYTEFTRQKNDFIDLQNQFDAYKNATNISIADKEKHIKIIEAELDAMKISVVELQTALNNKTEELKQSKNAFNDLKTEQELTLNSNKEQKLQFEKKITSLHNEIHLNEEILNKNVITINTHVSEIKAMKQEILDLKNTIDLQKNDVFEKEKKHLKRIDDLEQEITDYSNLKVAFEMKLKGISAKAKAFSEKNSELINILEGKTNDFNQKMKEQLKHTEVLEKELSEYKTKIIHLQEKLSKTMLIAKELQKEKEDSENYADGELNTTKYKLAESLKHVKNLEKDLQSSNDSRLELQQQLVKLKEKMKNMQTEQEEQEGALKAQMQKVSLENEKLKQAIQELKNQ